MKLTRIEVKNYRSLFVDESQDVFAVDLGEGMNAFVGPNNTGKSNLLRAVALALDPTFPFDRDRDMPGNLAFAFPRVTLEFASDGKGVERNLLRYAEEYEHSALAAGKRSYAEDGVIRFTVSYPGNDRTGATRQEQLGVRGVGARQGDQARLDKALRQFRKALRFVMIESGQDLESLLAGKFREILHTVIQDHLKNELAAAERRRAGYVEGLQDTLLNPLRDRIDSVLRALFPEIQGVTLVPTVPSIDETLSNVAVNLRDAVETSLAAKGTGVRGGVMVAMLQYLVDNSRRSMVFAVEEPEAFLHPAAQEQLRDGLEGLAERSDVTLLITTHSPFVVSRQPKASLVSLTKDQSGRTRIVGQAKGHEPYAALLGGLFRDAVLSDVIDRASRIPLGAGGVLFVEGTTDEGYLRLAAERSGRPTLLDGLHIVPAGGASKLLVEAVLLRAQTPLPIVVLLDNDQPGRSAAETLVKKFGFDKKRQVLSYADLFPQKPEGVEAEDLFPEALMRGFVEEHGESTVLDVKQWVQARKAWHYGFNAAGKDLIGPFLQKNAKAADVEPWLTLLETVRERLKLN